MKKPVFEVETGENIFVLLGKWSKEAQNQGASIEDITNVRLSILESQSYDEAISILKDNSLTLLI